MGLEADLGGCSLAADGFGCSLSVWGPSLHLLFGRKLATNTSPMRSGQNKAVLNSWISDTF